MSMVLCGWNHPCLGGLLGCYAVASCLILSGLNPAQCCSPACTTGAWRYPSCCTYSYACGSWLRSIISYSMPVLSSSFCVNLHWVHAGFE